MRSASHRPEIFLDGRYFHRIGASDIDAWTRPDRIAAIEIYTEASVPSQFRRFPGRADADVVPCGSILIWTK